MGQRFRLAILVFVILAILSGAGFSCRAWRGGTKGGTAPVPTSPIHRAAADGNRKLLEKLLEEGAPVDGKDRRDWTPLHWAVLADQTGAAAALLDHGADPNARAQFGMTPLHWAAMKGEADMVALLLSRGARPNLVNLFRRTPLHDVGHYKAAELLIQAGAKIDAPDMLGMTPLHTARDGLVAKALFRAGANPTIPSYEDLVPMQLAVIESLEPQGIGIQVLKAPMRLRGAEGTGRVTFRSVTERSFEDLVVSARSEGCNIGVVPERLGRLEPGQIADFSLRLVRRPEAPEGTYFVYLAVAERGVEIGRFELKVNTSAVETPEDQGMIRIGTAKLQKSAPRRYYLVYAVAPFLVGLSWLVHRWRSRSSKPSNPS